MYAYLLFFMLKKPLNRNTKNEMYFASSGSLGVVLTKYSGYRPLLNDK